MAHTNKVGRIYNFLCQHLSIKVGEASVAGNQTEAKARSLHGDQWSQCELATVR